MKKKSIAVAALASCLTLTATLTGCSLVSTNSKADMAQEIASVNITKADAFKDSSLNAYKEAITGETAIVKRDLVSYFVNIGYSYVQNDHSYEETFNMLLDALVNNAVLVQYSTMALLEEKAKTEGQSAVLSEYMKADKTQAQKYEYLLDGEDVLLAKYNLYSSLNRAIDNYEKTIIEEESEYTGTATRTTPANLNTEQDDYYPKTENGGLNYNVYTGYAGNLLDESGAYKDDALEGTTTATRIKAYNKFLNNLRSNDLIEDSEADKLRNIDQIKYVQEEYVSQLESRIINRYYDVYQKQQEETLLKDNYIENIYQQLLKNQTKGYSEASAFETALGNMSSTSFLLYSPDTSDDNELEGTVADYSKVNYGRFGFVYNILLPFNSKQSLQLSNLKSYLNEDGNDNYYYNERNKLLRDITTEDQRAAWFNGATDYSFKASEKNIQAYGASDYLFFEGNLTESGEGGRYKKLQAYDGRYSYNGSVYENEDGSYTLLGNPLTIDDMLKEFSDYVNFVISGNKDAGLVKCTKVADYYGNFDKDFHKADDKDEIDYTKLLYAYGNVELGNFSKNDLFNANAQSNQYKAMSAVNELQFAYTTDTSVLSQYAGYSVSAYKTSYIKEFEYAAKLAISNGEGAFTVCAGDYGWHLIYVTYVFGGGEVYTRNWDNVNVEGTFENLFFEWIKGNDLSDVTTNRRSKIVNDFNKEDVTVVKYTNRYSDLLEMQNN